MSWRDRENRGMERGKETKAERNRKELWRQRKGGAMAAKVAELDPGSPGCSCPQLQESLPASLPSSGDHWGSFLSLSFPSNTAKSPRIPSLLQCALSSVCTSLSFPNVEHALCAWGGDTGGPDSGSPKHFPTILGGHLYLLPSHPRVPSLSCAPPQRYPSNSANCDYGSQAGGGEAPGGWGGR